MSPQSKPPSARLARAVPVVLGTWLALAAVWMLLVDNETQPELWTGVGVACIATLGSELVRAQRMARIRVHPLWLLRLWRPLARMPLDVGLVMWALVRQLFERKRARGRPQALRFRATGGDPAGNARRALAEAAGSMAPNTIVIGVDVRRRLILAHQLVPTDGLESKLDPLELR